jgi:glycosyltransferase involved in cell wall biosynthesis
MVTNAGSDGGRADAAAPGFLFVTPWEPAEFGGVGQVVMNLWRQMEADGRVRPLLLVADWNCRRPEEALFAGRPAIRYRLRDPAGPGFGAKSLTMFWATLPATMIRLRAIVRRFDVVAINVHYPSTNAILFVLLRWLGLYHGNVILSFHGADLRAALAAKGLERLVWRLLAQSVDCSIAVSKSLAHDASTLSPECAVAMIHNGLDVADFVAKRQPDAAVAQVLAGRRFVLSVAAYQPWKGQDVLIRAFAGMAKEFPDLLLVLIGEKKPGTHAEDLRREITRLALADRVLVLESVPHALVAAYLKQAALFVLPSRLEPFGIALLEAGAFGLPVVATTAGGIPEIITDGETGRLVPPEDADALREQMVRLLHDPAEAKRLGEALRRHVSQNFSWRRAYEQYMALLRNAPGEKSAASEASRAAKDTLAGSSRARKWM